MTNLYITSDTHYGHMNMVKGTSTWEDTSKCRAFDTMKEHNEMLIQNINAIIKDNDILYHVGDFAMGRKENVQLFRERLNVKTIYLVRGNHDYAWAKGTRFPEFRDLFTEIRDIKNVKVGKDLIVLCHFLFATWENMSRGSMMLHGHLHSTPQTKWRKGRALDIGIDGSEEFRPYHLIDEVIPFLKEKPVESFIGDDHHLKHN